MKNFILFLILFFSQFVVCCTFEQAKEIALKKNLFIAVYFCETSREDINVKSLTDFFKFEDDDKDLFDKFFVYTIYKNSETRYSSLYKIVKLPTILIVDGNGLEIGRYNENFSKLTIRDLFRNFQFSDDLLSIHLKNFNQNKNFYSSINLVQSYYDYSLTIEKDFKPFVFNVCNSYLELSMDFLKPKNENYQECIQKAQLFELYNLAYSKKFSELNRRLSYFNEESLISNNLQYFYFLKYMVVKGLKLLETDNLESKFKAIEGFDFFIKKADFILKQEI